MGPWWLVGGKIKAYRSRANIPVHWVHKVSIKYTYGFWVTYGSQVHCRRPYTSFCCHQTEGRNSVGNFERKLWYDCKLITPSTFTDILTLRNHSAHGDADNVQLSMSSPTEIIQKYDRIPSHPTGTNHHEEA
jgi:hypothetical protein